MITSDLRPRLHEYLGGLVNSLHGTPLEINGTADHVHVLAKINPVISISEFSANSNHFPQVGPGDSHEEDSNGRRNTERSQ